MKCNEDIKIRWEITDPKGRRIILKQSTYEEHICKDHLLEDAEYRKSAESQAKETIKNPQLIVVDKEDNDRLIYYKIIRIPYGERKRLKNMKVIVDSDRKPYEVVTWIIQSKLKDTIMEEWIEYAN
ncbi:MAG: hypothetical protein IJ728_13415 [Selenomonadaceae bacterium]|nr:hypothetical protein [Selenomonadaceae bacterium]